MRPIEVFKMSPPSTDGLVSLINVQDTIEAPVPGPAVSGFSMKNNGTITINEDPTVSVHTWLLSGPASDYDVKVVPIYGTFSSGYTNLWLNLGATRSWSLSRSTSGQSQTQALIYIKKKTGSSPIEQSIVTLTSIIEF